MQEVIAGLEKITFDLEDDVENQRGIGFLPFPGMDKSGVAVCTFFLKGLCEKGKLCPFRHDDGEKTVVCKHWLRGLCKKSDQCKFLHQYDITKMPECYFYSKFGPQFPHLQKKICRSEQTHKVQLSWPARRQPFNISILPEVVISEKQHHSRKLDLVGSWRQLQTQKYFLTGECCNKECLFLHADPASKTRDCPWYDQGFCKYGSLCKFRHIRRVLCTNYLVGFCPEGPGCRFAHPKMMLLLRNASHSKNVSRPRWLTKLDYIVEASSEHSQQESSPPEVSSKPTVPCNSSLALGAEEGVIASASATRINQQYSSEINRISG